MARAVVVVIALIVGATVALLWWISTHQESSTDVLAFIFVPLYAIAAILGVLLLALVVHAIRTGRAFRRDQRRI